jgi:adenosylcobinamide-GDP ribazoletransferase
MKHFLSAIRFLTILPIGTSEEFQPQSMMACFPLVGLVIGIFLALLDLLFSRLWTDSTSALLDVVLLVVLTGAFHIDGLGDSADGLYGDRSREKTLAIMKDSRIGTMALSAIVCTLAVKWAGLAGIADGRFIFLLIIPAYARTTSLLGFYFLPYGRPDGGTGHAFFKEPVTPKAFRYFTLPFILSLFTGWRGILLNLVFGLTLILILGYYRKKMGCITGDMLGAMVEITEAALFLAVSMGGDL